MIKLAQVSPEHKAVRLHKNTLNIKEKLQSVPRSKYSNPSVRLLQGYAPQASFGQNKIRIT